jgi:hypothetical protein
MHEIPSNDLRRLIGKIPHWIRTDLSSHDAAWRERAEDALHAMLSAVLGAEEPPSSPVT